MPQFRKMSPPIQPAGLLDLSFVKIRDLLVVLISDNIYYDHDEETQELVERLGQNWEEISGELRRPAKREVNL